MLARLEDGVAALPAAQRRLYERGLRRVAPGTLAASFRADVAAGKLPKVSYLVPSSVDSEHPSASSPSASAVLIYDILDALASTPDVWSRTVLLITFDEFDGYFDHKPLGLGFRVPTTVVSPWSTGGFVSSETFDHTSVVQFLERWTGVREPNISRWRRRVCGDLTSAFDFHHAGRRPALTRPVPYRPEASARVDGRELVITLRDKGSRGSHFTIYPYRGELPTGNTYRVAARTASSGGSPGGFGSPTCWPPCGIWRRLGA